MNVDRSSLPDSSSKLHDDWFEFIRSPPDIKMHSNVDGRPSAAPHKVVAASPQPHSSSTLQTSTYDIESLELVVTNRRHRRDKEATKISSIPSSHHHPNTRPTNQPQEHHPYHTTTTTPPTYGGSSSLMNTPPPSTIDNNSFDTTLPFDISDVVRHLNMSVGSGGVSTTPSRPPPPIPTTTTGSRSASIVVHPSQRAISDLPHMHQHHSGRGSMARIDTSLNSSYADGVERQSFMINLWLGTHSLASTSPTQVLVHHRFRYFTQLCEKAANQLSCRPSPQYLFTPDGRVLRRFSELHAGGHYLILPAGCAYREASVPLALLEILAAGTP